jgi:hypothetical protein
MLAGQRRDTHARKPALWTGVLAGGWRSLNEKPSGQTIDLAA